jgi:hypothetical protein
LRWRRERFVERPVLRLLEEGLEGTLHTQGNSDPQHVLKRGSACFLEAPNGSEPYPSACGNLPLLQVPPDSKLASTLGKADENATIRVHLWILITQSRD